MFAKLGPGWRASSLRLPAGRMTLAGVLVAAVVGVAFGTGYTTTRALANDGSAWLQKGDTIVHVNGPSGRYDAVVANRPTALAASVRDPLQIVETPNSQVYATDPVTHKVYRIDLSSMTPQSLGAPGTDVLAAGDSHFVVNAAKGTVTSFDPQTLILSAPVNVPGGVASEAITPSGVAYIGSNNGTVTVVDKGKVTTEPVASRGHPIEVSVVGNQPIAVDTANGHLHELSGNAAPAIALPGQPGATVQLSPSLPGNTAWLIRGTQLVEVNPGTGYSVQATLPVHDTFGSPVANGANGYVPDDTTNQVLVYDSAMNLARRVPVPAGLPGNTDIEMVVKDGNVWADDPTSSEATVIRPKGTTQTVYKGTGDGVVVPGQGRKPAPRTAPSAAGLRGGNAQVDTNQQPPSAASQTPATAPQASTGPPVPSSPPADTSQAPPANVGPPAPVSTPAPFVAPTPIAPAVTTPPSVPLPLPTPAPTGAPSPAPTPPASPPTAAPTTATPSTAAPPATKAPASTTTSTTSSTTVATTVVPRGLAGKAVTTACQAVAAAQLVCAPKDLGQAPQGEAPNVVTAVPKEGQTVTVHTSIEVDYYGKGAPVTVPQYSTGESPQTYCSKVPAGLNCSINDLKQGNPSGVVVSTSPVPGSSVAYGSTVTVNYYGSSAPVPVPTPGQGGAPADPAGYCTYANNHGFSCTSSLAMNADTNGVQGLADPGQPVNQVVSTSPAAGASVPYGSQLTASYFNQAGVRVPNCVGQAASSPCPAGVNWSPAANQGTVTAGNCGLVTAQTVAAGTVIPASGSVTPQYNACTTVGISEWHISTGGNGKVHYLEAGTGYPGQPGTWAGGDIAYGGAYVAGPGGQCPSGGSVPLIGARLAFDDGSGLYHYAFVTNSNSFNANGWSHFGIVGCVLPPSGGACPSGTVAVYSNTIDNVDWSWTIGSGSNGVQWCELQ